MFILSYQKYSQLYSSEDLAQQNAILIIQKIARSYLKFDINNFNFLAMRKKYAEAILLWNNWARINFVTSVFDVIISNETALIDKPFTIGE